jgi:hypothetical protein
MHRCVTSLNIVQKCALWVLCCRRTPYLLFPLFGRKNPFVGQWTENIRLRKFEMLSIILILYAFYTSVGPAHLIERTSLKLCEFECKSNRYRGMENKLYDKDMLKFENCLPDGWNKNTEIAWAHFVR